MHYLPRLLLLMAFIVCAHLHASGINYLTEPESVDTLKDKEIKKSKYEQI